MKSWLALLTHDRSARMSQRLGSTILDVIVTCSKSECLLATELLHVTLNIRVTLSSYTYTFVGITSNTSDKHKIKQCFSLDTWAAMVPQEQSVGLTLNRWVKPGTYAEAVAHWLFVQAKHRAKTLETSVVLRTTG
jgi:hypothetical protein